MKLKKIGNFYYICNELGAVHSTRYSTLERAKNSINRMALGLVRFDSGGVVKRLEAGRWVYQT